MALAQETEPELEGANQTRWIDRLEAEHENLRAALSWALEGGGVELGLRLAGALRLFWVGRSHYSEGRFGPTAGAGERFGRGAGFFTASLGDLELAREHFEDGLALYRQVGDRRGAATCLRLPGTTMFELGDWERAEALLEEGLALARESGSIRDTCNALSTLSYMAACRGDLERAKLDPASNLRLGANYKATVTTGVQDLAGNALEQNPNVANNQSKSWKFTVQ